MSANIYLDVYRNGQYYHPAYLHYGDSEMEIGCDRCESLGLYSCIGLDEIDLCMQCIAELDEYYSDGDLDINIWNNPCD